MPRSSDILVCLPVRCAGYAPPSMNRARLPGVSTAWPLHHTAAYAKERKRNASDANNIMPEADRSGLGESQACRRAWSAREMVASAWVQVARILVYGSRRRAYHRRGRGGANTLSRYSTRLEVRANQPRAEWPAPGRR